MTSNESLERNVVFSLEDGFVWASWPGSAEMVKLGRHEQVMEMMRDYLGQSAVGERLMNGARSKAQRPDVDAG